MATSPAEALQDQAEFEQGREIELACPDCGERWLVHVHDGEDVTDRQAECHCGGFGGEV